MGFSEFVGNLPVVAALRGMLASGRMPHAMLWAGPPGVGKFTLARMFAQAANCQRLRDDFCGECGPCRGIAGLANTAELVERGLEARAPNPDAATVERVPLLIETHPDVWAVVPDPIRLRDPVARPVLHVGQLRAVQRAAAFRPLGRRRVFIVDGAETMRWDHANIFLKVLEEPPETATLILLTTAPYSLLPTIRSRCLQFSFAPLDNAQVEAILRERTSLSAADRRLAAQLAEGSPGVAMTLDVEAAAALRRAVLRVLATAAEARSFADLFAQTAALAKGHKVAFESVLDLFYSVVTDLLELTAECAAPMLRNPALGKELEHLRKRVDPMWVMQAVQGLDKLEARARRNVNRQLGLDAVMLSLGKHH